MALMTCHGCGDALEPEDAVTHRCQTEEWDKEQFQAEIENLNSEIARLKTRIEETTLPRKMFSARIKEFAVAVEGAKDSAGWVQIRDWLVTLAREVRTGAAETPGVWAPCLLMPTPAFYLTEAQREVILKGLMVEFGTDTSGLTVEDVAKVFDSATEVSSPTMPLLMAALWKAEIFFHTIQGEVAHHLEIYEPNGEVAVVEGEIQWLDGNPEGSMRTFLTVNEFIAHLNENKN